MTDHAAALTYYAMMSLFPALLVGVRCSADRRSRTVTNAVDYVARQGADDATADAVAPSWTRSSRPRAARSGVALVVSVLIALNGASGAFGAAGRALNRVYAVDEDRGFVNKKLADLGMTLRHRRAVASSSPRCSSAARSPTTCSARSAWARPRRRSGRSCAGRSRSRARGLRVHLLPRAGHRAAPAPLDHPGRGRRRRALDRASIGFGIYIKNFSTYGAAYGAFGAVIVLLLWL